MRYLFQYFGFASFSLLSVIYLFGCAAQSQNLTNIIQNDKTSQTSTPIPSNSKSNIETIKEIELKIKGLGIGSTEKKVLQILGKPLESKKGEFDGCGDGFQKTLRYSGIVIELLSNKKGQDYKIISVDISSSEWMPSSGLNVGLDIKDIEAKLGKPLSIDEQEGQVVYFYAVKDMDGFANLFFRDNKLTRVRWILLYC